MKVGRTVDARRSMECIRGPDYKLEPEWKELEDLLSSDGTKVDYISLLTKKSFVLPVLILSGLFWIHVSVGADTLSYYALTLFIFPGVGLPPSIIAVLFQVSRLLSISVLYFLSLNQMSFTVGMLATALLPSVNRRTQFILGAFSVAFHMLLLGFDNYLQISSSIAVLNYLPVILLISFGLNFGVGIGTIPFTLTGEIFPQHLRTYGCAVTTASRYVMQFIQLKLFFLTVSSFGMYGTYFFQSGVAILGAAFAFCLLPETRNKTFSELENMFKRRIKTDLENK